MEEQKKERGFEPRSPDYKGEGIAIWKTLDKNGKVYLKVRILGNITLNAFKNEPKIITEEV